MAISTVIIEKGESKKVTKLDPEQKLLDLRKILATKGMMSDVDLFQFNGGDISKVDESDFTGKDIIIDGTLTLKGGKTNGRSGVNIKPGETPSRPGTGDLTGDSNKFGLDTDQGLDSDPTDTVRRDTGTAKTEDGIEYIDLSPRDREKLFARLQLSKAIKLTNQGFQKCFPDTIVWMKVPGHVVPENTLRVNKSFSFSKTIHELRKRGVKNVKASGGGFGVAVSSEYTHEKESLSRKEKTTAYLLATYDVPKIRLSIPVEHIQVSPEFGHKVSQAISHPDSVIGYNNLLDVLNQYGFYVPTEFTLGGQIYAEDRRTVESTIEAESESESFAVAMEANLTISGVPVNAGGGYGQSDSTQETNAQQNATRAIQKQVRGGDPAKANESAEWIASLGPYKRWAIMEYVELTPTITFLNPFERAKCVKLINQHFLSAATQAKTAVDMGSYASSLIAPSSDDF